MGNTRSDRFVLGEMRDDVPVRLNYDESKDVDVHPDNVDRNEQHVVYNPRKESL